MRQIIVPALAAALAVGAATIAFAQPPGVTTMNGALADASGKALYTFDKDATPGKSVCNGQCAQYWPPLAAAADAKATADWTVITRDDGSKQWAYKGKPVYGYLPDTAHEAGTGEKVAGWKLAK